MKSGHFVIFLKKELPPSATHSGSRKFELSFVAPLLNKCQDSSACGVGFVAVSKGRAKITSQTVTITSTEIKASHMSKARAERGNRHRNAQSISGYCDDDERRRVVFVLDIVSWLCTNHVLNFLDDDVGRNSRVPMFRFSRFSSRKIKVSDDVRHMRGLGPTSMTLQSGPSPSVGTVRLYM